MKLVSLVLLSSLVVGVLSISAAAQRPTAASTMDRSPEIVLAEFYKWYIHSTGRNVDPIKAGKATLKKYVTLRFIRVIERNDKLPEGEGFDADYFLQTQEETSATARIVVSNVAVKGATATAIVTFDEGYPRVRVSLVREGGAWKIDNVKNAARPPK